MARTLIALVLVAAIGSGCSSGANGEPANADNPQVDRSYLTPGGTDEVYILLSELPGGFAYVSAEAPTSDTHPNFAGAFTIASDNESVSFSIRWTRRIDLDVEEDRSSQGPPIEIAGVTVFAHPDGRVIRLPYTAATDVELLLDQAFKDTSPDLLASLIGAIKPATETEWVTTVEPLLP